MKPRIWGKIAILVILATAISGAILSDLLREHRARSAAGRVEVALPQGVPVLLELGSDSCRPFQMMQPVLEELRQEYDGTLGVVFVDVWKNPAVAEKIRRTIHPHPDLPGRRGQGALPAFGVLRQG